MAMAMAMVGLLFCFAFGRLWECRKWREKDAAIVAGRMK
jgi:hypothetical protein